MANEYGKLENNENVLDLGYNEKFERDQYFRLITLGIIKPKKEHHPPKYEKLKVDLSEKLKTQVQKKDPNRLFTSQGQRSSYM
jgi:hypothetical protein